MVKDGTPPVLTPDSTHFSVVVLLWRNHAEEEGQSIA